MPKSKLKPSEWIIQRTDELRKEEWFKNNPYFFANITAILDYLDQQEDNLTK